jgi:hypothetical protein
MENISSLSVKRYTTTVPSRLQKYILIRNDLINHLNVHFVLTDMEAIELALYNTDLKLVVRSNYHFKFKDEREEEFEFVKKSKNAYYTLSMYSNVQHLMKEEIDEKN